MTKDLPRGRAVRPLLVSALVPALAARGPPRRRRPPQSGAPGKRRPITFADFAAVRAVADPQLSPDGRTVLYAVRTTDVDANRRTTTTYLRRPAAGGAPRPSPDAATPPPRRAGPPTAAASRT